MGNNFSIVTFGESHGKAVGVVIDGVKPGLKISKQEIQKELDKRKPGKNNISSKRKEKDEVHILSGLFKGKTTGHPICLVVYNKDARSESYNRIKDVFRPGHAGYTYLKKYGIHDYRGGGRSSGRETIGRVAAGAVAKKLIKKKNIKIYAYVIKIGPAEINKVDLNEIKRNKVHAPDKKAAKLMEKEILKAKEEEDSLGGVVEVLVKNCPPGLGDPVFDKLDACLSKAMISVGAVKAIEFGAGFKVADMKGSENNDAFVIKDKKVTTETNNSGGILGGISTGQDIVFRVAVKPTPSIAKEQKTVDTHNKRRLLKIKGRHDPCICPRIVPVLENMTAIVIAEALMRQEKIR
jgi:chorismate synthase